MMDRLEDGLGWLVDSPARVLVAFLIVIALAYGAGAWWHAHYECVRSHRGMRCDRRRRTSAVLSAGGCYEAETCDEWRPRARGMAVRSQRLWMTADGTTEVLLEPSRSSSPSGGVFLSLRDRIDNAVVMVDFPPAEVERLIADLRSVLELANPHRAR